MDEQIRFIDFSQLLGDTRASSTTNKMLRFCSTRQSTLMKNNKKIIISSLRRKKSMPRETIRNIFFFKWKCFTGDKICAKLNFVQKKVQFLYFSCNNKSQEIKLLFCCTRYQRCKIMKLSYMHSFFISHGRKTMREICWNALNSFFLRWANWISSFYCAQEAIAVALFCSLLFVTTTRQEKTIRNGFTMRQNPLYVCICICAKDTVTMANLKRSASF